MEVKRRKKVIRRDAGQAQDLEVRAASLIELERPDFLSIVKRPANRSPFAIVRSADGKKQKRTYDTPLLSIALPANTSEEDAKTHFRSFGLKEEEYEIVVSASAVMLRRIALDEGLLESASAIAIADGITAYISRSEMQEELPPDVPSIGLVKLTFDSEKFPTRADCEKYLRDCEIVFNEEDLFSIAKEFVYVRHDCDTETREITVSEGVQGVFAQTRRTDVPAVIYRAIIEEAYGQHGWGHMDFFQALSDQYFTSDAREANRMLWDVLDNILFYSYLPLSDRQALVDNALQEFSVYLRALMSALPRAAQDNRSPEGTPNNQSAGARADSEGEDAPEQSTTVDTDSDPVTRNDDMPDQNAANPDETKQEAQNTEPQYITREDVEKLVKESAEQTASAVVAALRGEPAPKQEPKDESASSADLVEVMRGITDRLEQLGKVVDGLKSTQEETVSRADDDAEGAQGDDEERIERSEPPEYDKFRGAIFRGDSARVIAALDRSGRK